MITLDFIVEYFDELEADFQREYGLDFRDSLYGEHKIGVRRLSTLIENLTLESATMRKAITGGRSWTSTDELLALLCELTDQSNRMYHTVHFQEKTWDPLQIPRPYEQVAKEEKKQRDRTPTPKDELVSFFGKATTSNQILMTPEDPGDVVA